MAATSRKEGNEFIQKVLGPMPGRGMKTRVIFWAVALLPAFGISFLCIQSGDPILSLLPIVPVISLLVIASKAYNKFTDPKQTPYFYLRDILEDEETWGDSFWWITHEWLHLGQDAYRTWLVVNQDKKTFHIAWSTYPISDLTKVRSFGQTGLALHFKAGNVPVAEVFFENTRTREIARQHIINKVHELGHHKFREA